MNTEAAFWTVAASRASGGVVLFEDGELPDEPDEAESQLAAKLGDAELVLVDQAIKNSAIADWRKVARVVCDALEARGGSVGDQAQVCLYVRRVIALVANGALEAEGNLRKPRRSEIRVPGGISD